MLFEFDPKIEQKAKLKVIGVGGAGGNAINRMIKANMSGVEFIAVNTDAQDLENNSAEHRIQIGKNLTKGLGAGAQASIGHEAMTTDREAVQNLVESADMVFITAGMGGGTGTGAAPVVAQIANDLGILTVGIVTLPFKFEGPRRFDRAMEGISEMRKVCDTVIIIPNQKLMSIVDKNTTLSESFLLADSILHQAAKGISDLINVHGMINLDFADVETVMKNMGQAIMGTGCASGEERAVLAAQQAISSPLLDSQTINGAQGVLVNITGGEKMTLHEVDEATSIIFQEAGKSANIIFGAVVDKDMKDDIQVTVIATGFNQLNQIDSLGENQNIQEFHNTNSKELMNHRNETLSVQKRQSEIGTKENNTQSNPKYHFDGTSNRITDEEFQHIEKIHKEISDLEVPAFIRRQHQ
ncbi:MAG: cell division protein FtsZ [Candidatus Marinimicrobia bacterium]|nr:cell division protein FtsZ [Candidatus Neomarinimicrobiota bacterium]|tara:strand:- start:7221 stop:8456 length:1236 start_codon:yes stop_codon:yes gene_type:complete